MAARTYKMYINGEFVDSHSKKTFEVINPANQEVLGIVPDADREDVNRAVAAARECFDSGAWPGKTHAERGRALLKLADVIRNRTEELARLECLNNGKPIVEAEADMSDVASCFEYYGGLANKIHGEVLPVPDNALSLAIKEPIGVAGQIIPWNYPLLMAAWKLAPALAAGCTCVIKPAEQTPLSLLELASSFHDVGLPSGAVNIVTGFGETGHEIVVHQDVDKIAFTGSVQVGKLIMKNASDTLKRVSLELGGKSPNIFFADADFEAAVDGALFGVFINQGEVCSAGSRILVQKSIYDKFLERMTEKAKNIKLGNGLDRDTKMGPVINQEQLDRVQHYMEVAKKEKLKVAIGGDLARTGDLSKGFFVQPTIYYDVDNRSTLAQE